MKRADGPTPKTPLSPKAPRASKPTTFEWDLRLYVAGSTPRSIAALQNLQQICEDYLPGRYQIEVVDLLKSPHLAQSDQILAVPALVRRRPEPVRKIVGTLANTARVLVGLELRPNAPALLGGDR